MVRIWSGLSVILVAFSVTASCSSSGEVKPGAPTPPAEPHSTSTQAPSPPTPPASAALTTSCEKIIGHDRPGQGGLRVLDVVVIHLNSPSAQVGTSEAAGFRHFAKVAVSVRGRREASISIPEQSSGALAVSWASSPNPPGVEVNFAPCGKGGGSEWTTYPGGFYFNQRQCATVLVRVGEQRTREHIPLGARCD